MVLTKADLQDWNSNPVTKAIFEGLDDSLKELQAESCMRPTSDETAMMVALNEGIAQGINTIRGAFEILEEDSE